MSRPIVEEYEPDGFWLWTQWEGTIREMTYQNILIAVLWAVLVDLYAYHHYTIYIFATAAVNGGDINSLLGDISWISLEIPHSKDPFIETLTALNSLWEYQLSLTIFTLSFFVNHAYNHWRMVCSDIFDFSLLSDIIAHNSNIITIHFMNQIFVRCIFARGQFKGGSTTCAC